MICFHGGEAAQAAGDAVASNAIKILMNSFYGVLGTPACRFYNPALANSITGTGKAMLLWSKRWFEAAGFVVLYGDTDSLFVLSGMSDSQTAFAHGQGTGCAVESRNRCLYRIAVARDQPPGTQVREAVREAIPAARTAQHTRRQQTLRGIAPRWRGESNSRAWRSCGATGRRWPNKCNASCTRDCSPVSRWTRIWPISSSACARVNSTQRSCTARIYVKAQRTTPPARRRTWWRHASQRSRWVDSSAI